MTQISTPSKVTVIIPTYKHEQFIAQCLESVLGQTQPPAEIIVINDGSPDNTDLAVEPYLPYIRYYKQENHGISYTINQGFSLVQTEYIQLLASDDWLHPKALETLSLVLEENLDVALVHANRWKVDENGESLPDQMIEQSYQYNPLPSIVFRDYVFAPAVMIRASTVNSIKPIPDFPYCQDWAFYIMLSLCGYKFYAIPAILGYYRRHQHNTTHSRATANILQDEISMLKWLQSNGLERELNAVFNNSIALRNRKLGWYYLSTKRQLLARSVFTSLWQSGFHDKNIRLGLITSYIPNAIYQTVKRTRQLIYRTTPYRAPEIPSV